MTATDWSSLISSWLPFFVLIAIWIFLSRSMAKRGGYLWGSQKELIEAQVAEMRRTSALLERIAMALERDKP